MGVPDILGGYVETNVYVHVRLRGVNVARGLQEASTRKRPHNWTHMERYRWESADGICVERTTATQDI